MSCKVNIDNLSDDQRERINEELKIKLEDNKYSIGMPPRYIFPYEIEGDNIYLPFSYAYRVLKLVRPKREYFSSMSVKFEGEMREEQREVYNEALTNLSKKGSVIVSCYCGFGKTFLAIKLACKVGLKTLIIVNKIVLMKQWEESILRFCPESKVQKMTPKSVKKDSDFYIMNAINVCKLDREIFEDIGCVIVDESHLIMAETLSRSLQYVNPRYLLGLSATPYRPDGLNVLLDLYFGEYKIVRKLYREHLVYKVMTGFTPSVELARNGKVNWGVVLDSQANDVGRNELIVSIVKRYEERVFLILTKRVEQGNYLVNRMLEEGIDVTSLIGSNQIFDENSRVLVGTSSKVGTGFDHPRLNTLLLAGDVEEYFIQFLGRVFRTREGIPMIFDLVDNNPIIKRHFSTRQSVYLEHGGKVKKFDMKILESN